jgi:hypothetical protein
MRAWRDHPFAARLDDLDRLATRAFHLREHALAGQGERNENRAWREAVALSADRVDMEFSKFGQDGNLYKKIS